MEYQKDYEIRFISKSRFSKGNEIIERYSDTEWDTCIERYRELESMNYTVTLIVRDITLNPILSHGERHIHV